MASTTANDPWTLPELTRARRAIVVVDVVESVRLMQEDEAGFIERWRRFVHQVRHEVLPKHGGRMVKSLGDGMLLVFESVPAAVSASFDAIAACGETDPQALSPLQLRVGVHAADIVVDETDAYGSGINLAARLGTLAKPNQVTASTVVRDQLVDGLDANARDLGECYLKHIEQPVRVYCLDPPSTEASAPSPAVIDLRASLAVLPFASDTRSARKGHVGDVLSDELTTLLSRGARLRVISRLSSCAFRARTLAPSQIGRSLSCDYLVSGRVRSHGRSITANIELVHVAHEEPLWNRRFAGNVSDLLTEKGELAREIATAVSESIAQHQLARAHYLPLPSLEAHSLLLAGVTLMHRFSRQDFGAARRYLEALTERVPRHPDPWAWLARWHVFQVVQGWTEDPHVDRTRALDCARRALDQDDHSPLALTIAGSVEAGLAKNLDRADALYERALQVDPNEPLAWLLSGTSKAFRGDGEQAMTRTDRAIELSPLDPMRFFYDVHAAGAALTAGEYERAIQHAERSLRANRMHVSTYRSMAIAQSMLGRRDEARATVAQLLTYEPGLTVKSFLARSPGGQFEHGKRFAQALREAGLPEH
jgi:class 3 adenylate cyclase/tetratricopeptide (TPR) repeat protein